ncbi:MAG TPA: WbqC family protein [Edaphocola sp.]|nr:WbqC family protein [Edaphocola sp.]
MSDANQLTLKKASIAAAIPFPPISWWLEAMKSEFVILDKKEPFQKMSYRNRYYLAGKQGKMLLSIPLSKGRGQHLPMEDVKISYAENWQKNHWKSIQSLLGNTPFFEYLDYQIQPFFEKEISSLFEWNKSSIVWANDFLGNPIQILESDHETNTDDLIDLRAIIHPKSNSTAVDIFYNQVFQPDIGFIADCSILDLICCEGKNAINILKMTNS